MTHRLLDTSDSVVSLASGASALSFPPTGMTGVGAVPVGWNSARNGIVPRMLLRIWSDDAAVELTGAELFAGVLQDGTLADDDVDTVDFANNELDITGHAYQTGDGPVQLTTSGTLPAGLALATDYYIRSIGSGTIKLYTTRADAIAGTNAVAFTDAGSGTHTISDTAETKTVRYKSLGLLGPGQYGAISLTNRRGYQVEVDHHPGTLLYALSATIDTDTVDAEMLPLYS